jgi:hypothetical protein
MGVGWRLAVGGWRLAVKMMPHHLFLRINNLI